MLRDYFETSVRRRLTLLIMLTALAVLALATFAFFISGALSARRAIVEELQTLAQVVGANSTAALSFGDRKTAEENLSALSARPDILHAGLFDARGELFASYVGASFDREERHKEMTREYQLWRARGRLGGSGVFDAEYWGEIEVVLPVVLDGREIGSLLAEASFARLRESMVRNLAISAAVMVVALLIALLLSARLQRTFSGPVLELADTMRTVATNEAYATRVGTTARDEIGVLFSAFNQMLEQIELRDQRLALVSERLKLALDTSGIGLWDWDIARDSVYLDRRWAEMMGAEPGESSTTTRALAKIVPPEDRERGLAQVLLVLRGAAPIYDVEHRVWALSGSTIWVHSRGAVVARDANGRATRMIGTNIDVTQRKQDETELRDAKEAAEHASRAKSQFLANMSHEIRTPMNGMLGMTELLLSTELNQRQRRLAQTARQSGTALLKIINDILDFSKIEAGKLELEHFDFDLRRTMDEVVGLFVESAQAKRAAMILEVDATVPSTLRGDAGRLRQILTNLVANAIKFTDQGEIIVRVRLVGGGGDHVVLRFEVRDTGIGIELDAQSRIFDSFSQADGSSTRRYGGTGLGLAICKHLVGLFNGEIGVSSQPGRGSLFWFAVPFEKQGTPSRVPAPPESPHHPRVLVAEDHAANLATPMFDQLHGPSPAPAGSAGVLHVLVVEDNAVNQAVATEMLSSLGCTWRLAENGREALEAIAHNRYGLVLMDCQMPEMDGFEATRLLREREAAAGAPRLRVIALTAHAMEGDRERCFAAGMDDFLAKPYDRRQLERVILRYRGRSPERVVAPVVALAGTAGDALERRTLDNIRALDKSGGNAVLHRVIGIYLKSAPTLVQAMRGAADAGDAAAVGKAAHSLKSSSLNVGAARLGTLCREIEAAAKAKPPAATAALLAALESEYLRVERLLRDELKTGDA